MGKSNGAWKPVDFFSQKVPVNHIKTCFFFSFLNFFLSFFSCFFFSVIKDKFSLTNAEIVYERKNEISAFKYSFQFNLFSTVPKLWRSRTVKLCPLLCCYSIVMCRIKKLALALLPNVGKGNVMSHTKRTVDLRLS